jgi:ATP-binding cassette subfamily C protein LapB
MNGAGFLIARLAGNHVLTPAAACLAPLLDAMAWSGTPRQLAESLTGTWDEMNVQAVRNTMANLRYSSTPTRMRRSQIDKRLLPCLFEADDGAVQVITLAANGDILVFDGTSRKSIRNPKKKPNGTAYFFAKNERGDAIRIQDGSWLKTVAKRFDGYIGQLLMLTFLLNMLALTTPLFVMSVYDRVIATGEKETLVFLGVGIGLAILCDIFIRMIRGALLAQLGGRMEMIVGTATVDKILDLPLARLEKAAVGTQVARLKEFEGIRGFFSGPLAMAFLELPFVIIFIIAIAFIGGWIALVPVGFMIVFGVLGAIVIRYARAAVKENIEGSADAQGVLIELLQNAHSIKADGAEQVWMQRYRERSTRLALSSLKNARVANMVQTFGQLMMILAGAGTLTIGTLAAANGAMTIGGLIASMAFVWRILSPMQMIFVAMTKLEEVKNGISRVDQLMAQPTESRITSTSQTVTDGSRYEGRITFSNVVLRYQPNHDPALSSVSFDIKPGEVVAIAGSNGSGKSSILKLIADLYQPQAGAVFIDGVDTRQINTIDLRQSIAYLPQQTDLFSGTVAQNLRLSNPIASDSELNAALGSSGVLDDVEGLPEGLETYLTEATIRQMSPGFRKGLAIARTLLNKSPIVLLDEPESALDMESDSCIIDLLRECRGKRTVLIVAHRPSYIREADRVLVMNRGAISFDGTPEEMAKAAQAAE